MKVSRKKVKKACIAAVEKSSVFDMYGSAERMGKAIDFTQKYFDDAINPIHKAELPYFIAVLDTVLTHLKSIDARASDVADSLIRTFDLKCGYANTAVEEAMRVMNQNNEKE